MRLFFLGLLGIPFFPLLSRAEVTATIEETHALAATGEVIVDNVNGPISVDTWDKPEVRLEAVKSARTDADLKALEVRVEAAENRFAVKSVYLDKDGSWLKKFTNTGEVRYKLTVPHTATLRHIETMNGSITIANTHARVTAKAMNGRIDASGLRDEVELTSVNGEVSAEFDAITARQDISLETVNGGVEIRLPADTSAEINASTVNGSISNDFGLPSRSENWVGQKLESTLGAGAGRIRLKSVNGSIRIRKR
jgi:hypothetical protein